MKGDFEQYGGSHEEGCSCRQCCMEVSSAPSLDKLVLRVNSLFEAIQHGDVEHKKWLKQAIDNHFKGFV